MKKCVKRFRTLGRVLLAVSLVLMTALMAAVPGAAAPVKKFELDQFIEPDTCGGCHGEIQEQWTNSMHNLSHKDPVYNRVAKFLRKGLTQAGEIQEAESCVKCHTPVGVVTGFPEKLSDDLSRTPEIATQGIQCDYCHSAVDTTRMYNNGLEIGRAHV